MALEGVAQGVSVGRGVSSSTLWIQYTTSLFFFFFWPCHATCRILVPRPGIEPLLPALGAWTLNHWAAREVPQCTTSKMPYTMPCHVVGDI